jgi:hypothetical protein
MESNEALRLKTESLVAIDEFQPLQSHEAITNNGRAVRARLIDVIVMIVVRYYVRCIDSDGTRPVIIPAFILHTFQNSN